MDWEGYGLGRIWIGKDKDWEGYGLGRIRIWKNRVKT